MLLSPKGKVFWISDINVWLSAEHLHLKDISISENATINEVFDALLQIRQLSMTYHSSSIPKSERRKNLAIVNAISEGRDAYGKVLETYDLALVQLNGQYYFFQLYGSEKGISYLHDDFQDVIRSVH